jgi:hypothetical protein
MFRAQTQSRSGYGGPIATTAFPHTCEQDNLEAPDADKLYRVQPGGYSVKPSVDAYKKAQVPVKIVFPVVPANKYGPPFDGQREWADVHTERAKAARVARGAMDIIAQEKQAASMFNQQPVGVLPTGAAAQTAYADYTRILALMQRMDFAQLVFPNNINAIANGVSKSVSTPLFSAFLAFMRQPPPPLPPQQQSKAMFVDLVKRAVMMNNGGYTWEDITGPINAIPVGESIPVAQAMPADEKGGGFAAFDGFPQPKP